MRTLPVTLVLLFFVFALGQSASYSCPLLLLHYYSLVNSLSLAVFGFMEEHPPYLASGQPPRRG